ncbi:hypothetical protein [Aeromicrobium sp. Sec7.5]|uniref:hypothetical protein n=1 Tax=Aeromicrobium sp. Sec7.5 TaxID=3121276 RepID=UPI002FE43D8E
MVELGTLMVLIGSALAVLQAIWVIASTGRRRETLRREGARSDNREAEIVRVTNDLRLRWGDDAADIDNYSEQPSYRPDPDLDRLLKAKATLKAARGADDWVLTYASVAREKAKSARELDEVEAEWRRLWTQGVPGLVGGLIALIGGVMTAVGGS